MNNDINTVSINKITFKLITKTKNITACALEEKDEASNIISFEGYTNQVAIKLYKEEEVDARIDIRKTGEIFIYENKELVSTIIPRITLEDDSLIAFNTSLNEAEDTILFTLESNEEKEIKAVIEFAITSSSNVYHIGAVNKIDYWYDTARKEVFKYDISSDTRVSIVAFNDFISVPYLAPKMISPNYLFFGEGIYNGSIYKINNNSLTFYKESDYNYLTALPKDLFIGIKTPNDNTTVYELVSFDSSLEFTVHDSYILTQEYPSSIYYRMPMVTSCDSLGKNINICFFTGGVMDDDTDFYYSAVIDLNNPSFNFSKSQKGIAIVKEAGPGPRIHYDVNAGKLYIGTIQAGSSIQPIFAQSDLITVLVTTSLSMQSNKSYIAYKHDGTTLGREYIYNSISATAYTVTTSNKDENKYEYIDMSVPKITEHINETNAIPLEYSQWYYSDAELEQVLKIDHKALFKGPQELYSKRFLSWTFSSIDSSGFGYSYNHYTLKDGLYYTRGTSTTDDILLDMNQYGIGCPASKSIFVLEKVDSLPVIIKLDTERKVKKTVSKKIKVDTLRKVIMPCETRCRRVFRKIFITGEAKVNNILRKVVRQRVFKLDAKLLFYERLIRKAKTRRKIIVKVEKVINTRRQVVTGREAIWKWIDTKLVITNFMRSRGHLLRKVAINANATIPNILRPVVWIYKDNDGSPIYLNTFRIIHKSINKKIKTLRRIDRIFDYDTIIKTNRFITAFSTVNISAVRTKVKTFAPKSSLERVISKNLYLSNSLLRRVSIGAEEATLTKRLVTTKDTKMFNTLRTTSNYVSVKPKLIRRIIFNNSICINALTRRNVAKDTDLLIDSNRHAVNKTLIKPNASRRVIINYISGYAFIKRRVVNSKYKAIDINRRVVIDKAISIDVERPVTIFKWFRSNLARIVGIRDGKSLDVKRIIAKDTESTGKTERKVSREYINLKATERVLANKPIILIDGNREVVKKNNICSDMIKKVTSKYIYLNSTERKAAQTIEAIADTHREINAYVELKVDTERKVENSKTATTLTAVFVLRKGLLYEIDSNYEYVNNNL